MLFFDDGDAHLGDKDVSQPESGNNWREGVREGK